MPTDEQILKAAAEVKRNRNAGFHVDALEVEVRILREIVVEAAEDWLHVASTPSYHAQVARNSLGL